MKEQADDVLEGMIWWRMGQSNTLPLSSPDDMGGRIASTLDLSLTRRDWRDVLLRKEREIDKAPKGRACSTYVHLVHASSAQGVKLEHHS
jgi:hypothetical protein